MVWLHMMSLLVSNLKFKSVSIKEVILELKSKIKKKLLIQKNVPFIMEEDDLSL